MGKKQTRSIEKTQMSVRTNFHWQSLEIYLLFHVVLKGLVTSFSPGDWLSCKWPVDLFQNLKCYCRAIATSDGSLTLHLTKGARKNNPSPTIDNLLQTDRKNHGNDDELNIAHSCLTGQFCPPMAKRRYWEIQEYTWWVSADLAWL